MNVNHLVSFYYQKQPAHFFSRERLQASFTAIMIDLNKSCPGKISKPSIAQYLPVGQQSIGLPVAIGLATGIALIVLVSNVFTDTTPILDPFKVTYVVDIVIPEGASLESSSKNFSPQNAIVEIIVGDDYCCNTVRWHNQDSVPAMIEADDDSDPDFYKATKGGVMIKPGESFDYKFTREGEFSYHGKPWQHGKVIVLKPLMSDGS
jgi:plastocyanin